MNETQQRKTPLQKNLDDFSGKLAVVIMVICAAVFLLSVFRNGMGVLDALMFAVALAVAAIPEALSSIVTIVLAMGTQKMARQHAIIKELKAVESLGSVQVICSDKTGTLTQNRMTVQQIWADGTLTPRHRPGTGERCPAHPAEDRRAGQRRHHEHRERHRRGRPPPRWPWSSWATISMWMRRSTAASIPVWPSWLLTRTAS